VEAAAASWNAKDVDAIVAAFTDEGLIAVFGEGEGEDGQPATVEQVTQSELSKFCRHATVVEQILVA